MDEQNVKNNSTECLLQVIAAVISGKEVPQMVRYSPWETVYKLADFHKLANIVYYGIIGLEPAAPERIRRKFYRRYRESILANERYQKEVDILLTALEKHKIHCMLYHDRVIRKYYPLQEMQGIQALIIYVEGGKTTEINQMMLEMDYELKHVQGIKGVCYYKIPKITIIFQEHPEYFSRKIKKYFFEGVKGVPLVENHRYIHQWKNEEFYLAFMAEIVEQYAAGVIKINKLLDLWLYYLAIYKKFDWNWIHDEMDKLEIGDFCDRIVQLAANWFGNIPYQDEFEIYEAMEQYILSQGKQGREISSQMLPLVKKVADFYERDRKREQWSQIKKWLLPTREYMEELFPILIKHPSLLAYYWCKRLVMVVLRKIRHGYMELREWVKEKLIEVKEFHKQRKELLKLKWAHSSVRAELYSGKAWIQAKFVCCKNAVIRFISNGKSGMQSKTKSLINRFHFKKKENLEGITEKGIREKDMPEQEEMIENQEQDQEKIGEDLEKS